MSDTPKLNELYHSLITQISKDVQGFQLLESLSHKLRRKTGEIMLFALLFLIALTILGITQHYAITFLGCIYPSIMSIKATQNKNQTERTRWLTYWIIFGFLIVFDWPLSVVLSFIPCYYVMKLLVIISLVYPKTDFSLRIYEKVLRPMLRKVEPLRKE